MSPRSYVTADRVARLERGLSERDRAIIETLDTVRVATTSQLDQLHFSSESELASARQTRKTLRRLTDARVLTQLDRRIGGGKRGSTQAVYALDAAGQRLASEAGPAGGTRLRRPWTPGSAFLAHHLAVTELFVRLHTRAREGLLELLAFEAEPLSWRRFAGLGGARQVLKPDAFVRVGLGDYEDAYFVEVDRATASLTAVARKCDTYRAYWRSGREQARFGVFPQVLWLVPDQKRKTALAEVIARQREEVREVFAVAVFTNGADLIAGKESA